MGLRGYGPLVSRAGTIAGILLAEILVRATLIGHAPGQVDYFPLPAQVYSLLLVWAGAVAILTAVEGSSWMPVVSGRLAGLPPRIGWLAAHAVLVAPVVVPGALQPLMEGAPELLQQVLQHLLFAAAILSLMLALVPAPLWREMLGGSSRRALVALVLATVVVLAIQPIGSLWEGAAAVTFRLVGLMIGPFFTELILDPQALSIVTPDIEIHIDRTCSGLEGVALMLVMCTGWLWYLHREFRFPRALLLVPVAAALMFLLNSVRIAILTALAAKGHVAVATAGFHSQAGWIFFIAAAFLVALASRRISWLRAGDTTAAEPAVHAGEDGNATTAFLLPLVAVLAAGMLTRAMSAGFDPLQWLRVPIAAALLLLYRRNYSTLDWRFGWHGIAAGVAVFGAWVLATQWLAPPTGMPQALSEEPPLQRAWWIANRALIAVLVVPVVEELAFRGYLMRRLKAADFTSVPFPGVGLFALLLSSILFGLSHGGFWLPGILAGLAFGAVAMRTGRIGDAVAAHAIANGLLCVLVLGFDQWQYW
jgi:exosortase E/protease (VPEID-CTERM system)